MNNYKVVFQLSSDDQAVHKALISQLTNLLRALPETQIEVAVHGPAVEFLLKETPFKQFIEELSINGLKFIACENTLNAKKLAHDDLLPFVKIVPAVVAHLVIRQHEGWAYIKAGF